MKITYVIDHYDTFILKLDFFFFKYIGIVFWSVISKSLKCIFLLKFLSEILSISLKFFHNISKLKKKKKTKL